MRLCCKLTSFFATLYLFLHPLASQSTVASTGGFKQTTPKIRILARKQRTLPLNYDLALETRHSISEVTVYSDSAEIHRASAIDLKPGVHWYLIGNLNANMEKSSVRLELGRSKQGKIVQMLIESTFEYRALPKDLQGKVTQLKQYYGALLDLQQTSLRLEYQLGFLKGLNFKEPTPSNTKHKDYQAFTAPVGTLSGAMKAVSGRIQKNASHLQRLRENIRKISLKIRHLHSEIAPATNLSDQIWLNHVYVLVHTQQAGSATLNLSYKIPNAKWYPRYDVRAQLNRKAGTANIKLVTAGLVEQHTGEDWENIRLTLSSLDPVPLYLPELKKWVFAENRVEVATLSEPVSSMADMESKEMRAPVPKRKAMARSQKLLRSRSLKKKIKAKKDRILAPSALDAHKAMEELAMESDYDDEGTDSLTQNGSSPRGQLGFGKAAANRDTPIIAPRSHNLPFTLFPLETIFPPLKSAQVTVLASLSSQVKKQAYVNPKGPPNRRGKKNYSDAMLPAVQAKGRLVEFQSPFKASLKNDDPPLKIPLVSQSFQAKLEYLAIPKNDQRVFLTAITKNSTNAPILAGPIQIFMNGNLISKSRFHTINEGGYFTVNLGVDPNVKSKREVVKEGSKEGLISKKHVTKVTVNLEIKNNHDFPLKLVLQDNYPKSNTDQIKIELLSVEPKPHDSKHGMLKWQTTIPQQSLKKFSFTYKVQHPENYLVSEFN